MSSAKCLLAAIATTASLVVTQSANAAVITFSQVVAGQTLFGFDGDGDGLNDVVFSTTDPSGFNTTGPGSNQVFIQEPGLEGASLLSPDLRVDFLKGAAGFIKFGFALNSFSEDSDTFTTFNLFDSTGSLLTSVQKSGILGTSTYPEGQIQADFAGIAAYGTFDFSSQNGRYIIDNFEGIFGSTEDVDTAAVPEPFTVLGTGVAIAVATIARRGKRKPHAQ